MDAIQIDAKSAAPFLRQLSLLSQLSSLGICAPKNMLLRGRELFGFERSSRFPGAPFGGSIPDYSFRAVMAVLVRARREGPDRTLAASL